jgi:pimeloyl-ACP methyl ester carboxylesterase
VVVGHGWGANVALSLAARRDGVAAVCCLDGGWIRPAWQYGSFEECWTAWSAGRPAARDEAAEQRRRSVVRSLFYGEPRAWFPLVHVPVVLCPVVPRDGLPDPAGRGAAARTGVAEALSRLPNSRISWYYGEGDAVSIDPRKLVDDLLMLAADAEPHVD